MTPVFQTITKHDPANGQFGNCLQAAVASLLDMKLYQVPHFCDGLNSGPEEHFTEAQRVNAWLRPQGLAMLTESYSPELLETWQAHWAKQQALFYHILSGLSPRGHFHATVAVNGKVVHDPHPEGGGVALMDGFWYFSFIVRFGRPGQVI